MTWIFLGLFPNRYRVFLRANTLHPCNDPSPLTLHRQHDLRRHRLRTHPVGRLTPEHGSVVVGGSHELVDVDALPAAAGGEAVVDQFAVAVPGHLG